MPKIAALLISVLLCSASIFSQTQSPVYLSFTISNANVKGYYKYLPSDYNSSTKSYPLIIWLHGAGQVGQGNPTDLPKVLQYGVPKIISEGGFPATFTVADSSYSFVVISPQFTAWPNGTNLGAMINYAQANFRINPDRIYVIGISAGGGAVWEYASASVANANKVAAIIPFCGTSFPTQTLANRIASANLPVWAFHNTNDGTVPVAYSRNWRNYINQYVPAPNPLAKLTEFPVVSSDPVIAHECWSLATLPSYKPDGINIYEWLLNYKKRVTPANIPPNANAGSDALVVLPNNLNLNGSLSGDPDGTITAYRWRKISGPTSYQFSDSTIANPVVQNLVTGTYSFELTVTDNQGASAKDTMNASVSPPIIPNSEQRILIDAGPPAANGGVLTISPSTNGYYWNNMTDARPGVRVSNAKTTDNNTSTINLEVINRIDGTYNTGGNGMNNVTNTTAVGFYPTSATTDYAFSHTSASNGRWRISGLDPNKVYVIKFWGSKSGETRDRDIEIKQSNETSWTSYSAASNTNFNNAASFNITGKTLVDFDIRTKLPSIFGYINVVDISWFNTNSPNQPPTANAGPNINLLLPEDSITLNGCNSSDPENAPLTFLWTKISGPAGYTISNAAVCSPKLTNLTSGLYTVQLMVTDTGGLTHKDTVLIDVKNPSLNWPVLPAPICPQPYKIVILGSSTSYGTDASPIDSSWVNKMRSYMQQQNAQVTVSNLSLGGYNTYHVNPTGYTPPANRPSPDPARNITAALALNPDAIIINLPTNDAASAFPVTETQDNFNRVVAEADAANIPVWVATSQPRNNLSQSQVNSLIALRDWVNTRFGNKAIDFWTNIANPDGTVNPTYSAGDGIHLNNYGHHVLFSRVLYEKIWDSICIRKNPPAPNQPPLANAGEDQAVGQSPVNLNGSASIDPEGMPLTFRWRVLNNPAGSLNDSTIAQPVFTTSNNGRFEVELTVKDQQQLADRDTVTIFVGLPNLAPVANAGTDKLITLPVDSVQLNGSASQDPDGNITQYLWKKISGNNAVINSPGSALTWVRLLTAGNYLFELTVTDDSLAINKDSMLVRVNNRPVANAGADVSITLPTNQVIVSGINSTDAEGAISSYSWRKYSGPAGFTISTPAAMQTNISFTASGVFGFELTVTDGDGATGKDSVLITVNPDPNQSPVANAGIDQTIQLPANKVLLDGRSSSDPDGSIVAYQWTYLSGPAGSQLLSAAKDTCSVSFFNTGTYNFRLTVTDNGGKTGTDDVQVTVQPGGVTYRYLKVNVYDGSNPFKDPQWNNWLPASNVNSANFKYDDGTQSIVNVNLSAHSRFSDNGVNYASGATACPPGILRINSIHTINRTLTVSGLNSSLLYNFEFYASRGFISGSKSIYQTGNVADTINTDFNESDYAKLNNIQPAANGKIVFTLSFTGTYHYFAGFKIAEPVGAPNLSFAGTGDEPAVEQGAAFSIYPNPFSNEVTVRLPPFSRRFRVTLTDITGKLLRQRDEHTNPGAASIIIKTNDFKKGIYFLQITTSAGRTVHKLVKQ